MLMDESLYTQFVTEQASGRKQEAKVAIRRFVESFNSHKEKEDWTRKFLSTQKPGAALRHELFEEIILPVLVGGYENRDPWSLYWLAETYQNHSSSTYRRLDLPAPQDLLKEAYALAPSSEEIRCGLLRSLLRGFEYMAHEWPAGLLYAPDSPWLTQYWEIRAEIQLARELDTSGKHNNEIAEFEQIVAADAERKKTRS
jgi:hypothetical protein